jgi:hypothetical protein
MIVRIQGEGQWDISGSQVDELDKLDDQILAAVGDHDEGRFHTLVGQLLDQVRSDGRKLPPEEIAESDLILPPADATMDEVKDLFASEGLSLS